MSTWIPISSCTAYFTRIRHCVFESFSPVQTKMHTIFYETYIILVVYMIYHIIVFENLRFGPSTRKWEAGVFKNLHSEERFWKAAFWRTVFTRYVWTGPKQGILSLLFKCLIIVVKIAKLVSTLAIRLAIRASKVATEHCCPPKWKFSFKGAFQKSELPADHGRTNHFDHEIGFFQEFLLKNHLLPTYHVGFDRSSGGWFESI